MLLSQFGAMEKGSDVSEERTKRSCYVEDVPMCVITVHTGWWKSMPLVLGSSTYDKSTAVFRSMKMNTFCVTGGTLSMLKAVD